MMHCDALDLMPGKDLPGRAGQWDVGPKVSSNGTAWKSTRVGDWGKKREGGGEGLRTGVTASSC